MWRSLENVQGWQEWRYLLWKAGLSECAKVGLLIQLYSDERRAVTNESLPEEYMNPTLSFIQFVLITGRESSEIREYYDLQYDVL